MSQVPPRTVLEIDQLCVKFGGLVAISSMSFHVDHGEIVSLIGPNGAGKTTAFNAITGYLQPSSGEARFLDKSLNGLKPNQIAELGVVRTFQKTSLFGGNTAFENIMIALHRQGRQELFGSLLRLPNMHAEERRLRDRADEILEFFGIAGRRDELASAMPYGEQRLLEVAIGLATEPEVLLLDEPASGMNPTETMSLPRALRWSWARRAKDRPWCMCAALCGMVTVTGYPPPRCFVLARRTCSGERQPNRGAFRRD